MMSVPNIQILKRCFIMKKTEKNYNLILYAILAAGFLIRVAYIIMAPYGISKHDLGTFSLTGFSESDQGHLGYISYLYHFKQLPDFDPRTKWAFYNPPGFHIISALWYGMLHSFGLAPRLCLESLQILTLLYVTGAIILAVKTLQEILPKGRILLCLAAFLSFSPFLTILSGTLNNDAQALFFSMLAILYALRWYRSRTVKNIIIIAVSIGLGMFTKLNVGLLAFPIGFLFIYSFISNKKERPKHLLQFALFALICAPLGLFWPVRNNIMFGMPLNYVPDPRLASQYVGDHSISDRIGLPSLSEISYPFLSFDKAKEGNIWVQMIRTSLFDEVKLPDNMQFFNICAMILFVLSLLGTVLSVVLWGHAIWDRNSMKPEIKLFFTIMFVTMLASYASFCFSYPYICTMNFRYIIPLLLMPCLSFGCFYNAKKPGKTLKCISLAALLVFIFFSIIMNAALITDVAVTCH